MMAKVNISIEEAALGYQIETTGFERLSGPFVIYAG